MPTFRSALKRRNFLIKTMNILVKVCFYVIATGL